MNTRGSGFAREARPSFVAKRKEEDMVIVGIIFSVVGLAFLLTGHLVFGICLLAIGLALLFASR